MFQEGRRLKWSERKNTFLFSEWSKSISAVAGACFVSTAFFLDVNNKVQEKREGTEKIGCHFQII
jgi:hypothetical protein